MVKEKKPIDFQPQGRVMVKVESFQPIDSGPLNRAIKNSRQVDHKSWVNLGQVDPLWSKWGLKVAISRIIHLTCQSKALVK